MKSDPAAHDLRTVARGALHQAEHARILQALRQAVGNRTKAAKLLKISRASLYNKIRDYQIELAIPVSLSSPLFFSDCPKS